MRYLFLSIAFLACACTNAEFSEFDPSRQCVLEGRSITCLDGTTTEITDGEDGSVQTITTVEAGSCTQVAEGIWVQPVNGIEVFDVYSNSSCRDALGEFCDNVVPSFGNSGQTGAGEPGSGTVCFADGSLVFAGVGQDGNSIDVSVIGFQ